MISFQRQGALSHIAAVIIALIVWQSLATIAANPKLLPSIGHVLSYSLPSIALFANYDQKDLGGALLTIGIHLSYTVTRIIVGLSVGGALGLLAGMGIHFFRRSRTANRLILSILRSVPLFALIPLFLHWFGGGETGIYVYIAFSVFIVVATNTYEAVCNVPLAYTFHARLLGAGRLQVFRTVYAQAIQPEMAGSLRNVIGLSWAFSLGAEYLAADSGLGYLVSRAYDYADMGQLIVFLCVYSLCGLGTYLGSKALLYNLRKWHSGSPS